MFICGLLGFVAVVVIVVVALSNCPDKFYSMLGGVKIRPCSIYILRAMRNIIPNDMPSSTKEQCIFRMIFTFKLVKGN